MSVVSTSAEEGKPSPLFALSDLDGLERVEKRIKGLISSDVAVLAEAPLYLLELGGKRVRPLLTLLVSKALGVKTPSESLIDIAAGIELIHMATLLHDDIIDNSMTRRHRQSPLARYGEQATLLAGDFLFVKAFGLCAKLDRYVIERTEEACVALTEGELLEAQPMIVTQLASCLEISRRKTAALFKLASQCGAHLSGASDEVTTLLGSFGEDAGIAFQVVDDILDVSSTDDLLGKATGSDLRERKPSVVNALWLRHQSQLANEILNSSTTLSATIIEQAKREMLELGVLEEARQIAKSYADKAVAALLEAASLTEHPNTEALNGMTELVHFTLRRSA